jgi:cytochrome c553
VRLASLVVLLAAAAASAQELPGGAGHDEVARRCLTCHESDLIAQQHLSAAGWGREVDKMVRWGAVVEAGEREPMIAYLWRHFGVAPVASHEPTSQADATYARACLGCHEADLIEAQRLGRPGWTREVEKMMRWGAAVSESEKEPLIDFLAARFPAR